MALHATTLSVLAGCAAVLIAGIASARSLEVAPRDPVGAVEVPDDWQTGETPRGVAARSPDGAAVLWFEVFPPADRPAVMAEHEAYLETQGIEVTGAPRVQSALENGVSVRYTDFPATRRGAPTVLRHLVFDFRLPSGKLVLVSYWASPEGDRTHDAAVTGIIRSLSVDRR